MATSTIRSKITSAAQNQAQQSLWARISTMIAVQRQRRVLATLEAHLLDDIGLTPAEAVQEAQKPVWDAPEYW